MNSKRTVFSLLIVAMLFFSVVMVPMASAKNTKDKNKKDEVSDELQLKLGRLSTDEIKELAKKDETVRQILEEDLKLDGSKIESMADLNCLPEVYSTEMKQTAIDNLAAEQIDGTVDAKSIVSVYVWVVADEEYRSHFGSNWQQEAYDTIESADNAFYADHDINFIVNKYSEWDSDDNEDSSSKLMDEAEDEMGWSSNQQGCDMMAIFTNQGMDHWGLGETGSSADAWIMKHQISFSWDWHLAQHESSHNYDCHDHGYVGPLCIMSYDYMMYQDVWCSTCDATIQNNRYHF